MLQHDLNFFYRNIPEMEGHKITKRAPIKKIWKKWRDLFSKIFFEIKKIVTFDKNGFGPKKNLMQTFDIFCEANFSSIFKKRFIEINTIGVPQSTMDSILASHPVAPDLILGIPKKFSLDVVEMYWRHCLEQLTEAW